MLRKRRQAVVEQLESLENTDLPFANEKNEVIKPARLAESPVFMCINTMEALCLKDIMQVI